ncbi:MAG: PD40 domain-containing protein [Chitinophagaceae bacterium]|nr:PD40 domain-containing protein [Chitinophagaceae bacterium]
MKQLLFSIICLLAVSFFAISQPYNPDKVNKKAKELYQQAIERAEDGQLANAAGILLKCIESDKKYVDAYLSLAGLYGQLKSHKNSISYYEQAFALDSNYTIEYKLPYSINLAGTGQFQKALDALNELTAKKPPKNPTAINSIDYRKKCFAFAVEYIDKNKDNYTFSPVNLGVNINSSESEYFPSLTIDGKQLIFTRRLKNFNEDFYNSNATKNTWSQAKPVEGNVNTPMNEGGQQISQDGEWLVFTGCNRRDGFGGCDIYISYKTSTGWSEAVNMGSNINSDQWESQPCLSPDKKDLFFASKRPGGFGGSDIYVSHLQVNGKWSNPENLGPGINTNGEEQCPFIHADNQTLYFTSNSWPGYGDDDLFVVRKGPGGDWSNPENLGYPINTINREGTLFIAADGKTAYYASDRDDSKGGLDIYSFDLRENVRPYRTLWVKGRVFDNNTGAGLPSAVELIDMKSKQLFSNVQTDEKGNYFITLPVGKDYVFNVTRKGYLFYSDNFFMANNPADSTYHKNIAIRYKQV